MSPEEPSEAGPAPLPVPRDGPAAPSRGALRRVEARAFAHLLVSDIRLYHEEEVLAGRARGDLCARLEEPLTAARARFARRFEGEGEIFEGEADRVLRGGDPGRLD